MMDERDREELAELRKLRGVARALGVELTPTLREEQLEELDAAEELEALKREAPGLIAQAWQ
jgi:hypothetical protein